MKVTDICEGMKLMSVICVVEEGVGAEDDDDSYEESLRIAHMLRFIIIISNSITCHVVSSTNFLERQSAPTVCSYWKIWIFLFRRN